MSTVTAGQSVQLQIGAFDGLWVNCSGVGFIDFECKSRGTIQLTSQYQRIGYYGESVCVELRCVSGVIDYSTSPVAIEPLTAKQAGDGSDSSPLDVKIAVNAASGGSYTVNLSNAESDADKNYEKIKSALTGSSSVVVAGGVVFVNDTVVVPSGKSLKTAAGTTIKMASGANKMVICSEGLLRAFTAATVAWNSADGRKFTVSCTAHGLSVGDGFCIQGSNISSFNTVFVAAEGTTADSIVAFANKLPTAAPTGSVSMKRLDRNTEIDVSADYNKAGGNNGTDKDTMCSVFAFLQDSNIKINGKDAKKYISQISGSLNVDIECNGDSVSDIMKFYGACRDIRGKVSGTSHDDCFSIQAKEPAAFINYQPAIGPISGVTISGFSVQQTNPAKSHSGGFVVYSDDEYEIEGVLAKNGSIRDSLSPAVVIRAGNTFSPASKLIKDVTIENVNMAGGSAVFNMHVTTKVETIKIVNPVLNVSLIATRQIELSNTSDVTRFVIDGWQFDASQFTSGSTYLVNLQGVLEGFLIENSKIAGAVTGNAARFVQLGALGVKNVCVKNSTLSYLNQICNVQAGSPVVPKFIYDAVSADNCTSGVLCSSNTDVYMYNSTFNTVPAAGRSNASGITVRGFDYGSTYTASTALSATTGGIVVPMTATTPCNISAATVSKTTPGAFAFSTAAAGTIPANRPVVCDGTNWKDMTNLSNVF